jgi:preprotein translocase subunit SecA
MMLNKEQDKGRLLQIKTGEGKSTIISIVAAYLALYGAKVDVVTSSEVLAIRDAQVNGTIY